MMTSAESAVEFVAALELPPSPEGAAFESSASDAQIIENDQLLSRGSQIAEFASGVTADLRKDISNSLLLAQLAADNTGNPAQNSEQWYESYVTVLKNTGWVVENAEWTIQEFSGQGAEVHNEIIPFVTAALAAGGAAAPIVVKLLEGLSDVHIDRPWITLFERVSKRAFGGQFQIAHVRADAQGKPLLLLALFGLDSRTQLVQILFLKLSESSVTLRQGQTALSLNEPLFRATAPAIAQKVAAHANDFIDNIDLQGIV